MKTESNIPPQFTPGRFIKNGFGALVFALVVGLAWATSASNLVWVGVSGTSTDTNWSDTANWGGSSPNGNSDFFGGTGAVSAAFTVNNVVDLNGLDPVSLTFTNSTGQFHTTLIPAGVSLTVTNALNVGGGVVASASTCAVAIEGGGGLTVSNLTLNGVAATNTSTMSLDMSLLNGFTNNAPAATMSIGTVAENNANLVLASNSFINVATINLETTGGNNGRVGSISLGATTNTIWANNINIGTGKAQTAQIVFSNLTGTVAIAGTNGAARATMVLGDGTSGSAVNKGQLLLAGNLANVLARTMTLGASGGSDSGSGDTGVVTFDTGTFDVTGIIMGLSTSSHGAIAASGSFSAGGSATPNAATLIVNSPSGPGGGVIVLGAVTGGTDTGAGTLTISNNCTADIYCSIIKSNAAQDTATLNVNSGTLNMEGATNTVGTSSAPINNVNLNNATLQLYVVGGSSTPVINAGTVTASGVNNLNISVSSVIGAESIPLISYTGTDPTTNSFVVSVPTNYVGTLVDDGTSLISLSLVPAGVTIYPLLWSGATNANWDYATTNWLILTNGVAITYTNPDDATFDDSASNSTVNLTAGFLPGSLVFSNGITANPLTGIPLAYTLTGAGSIGGSAGLLDANSGSVTLRETGGDSFTGGVIVNNGGTVLLDDANNSISGGASIGVNIATSTLQIGNNDAGVNPPSGNIVDDGVLVFAKTDSATISNTISGTGALEQNGSGTLTLAADNSAYTGNVTVSAGTLALTDSGSLSNAASVLIENGTGTPTLNISEVNSGITALNSLTLSNAVLTLGTTNQPAPLTITSTLTMSGTSSTINVIALPPIAVIPSAVTLVQAQSISGYNGVLGTMPAGFTGILTNNTSINAIQVIVTSGTTGQRPYVVWSGADLANNNTNWSDNVNWQLPGAPLPADNVIFNDTGAVSSSVYSSAGGGAASFSPANVNNIVNANFAVSTLNYTNLSAMYQNTYINDGATLTVTNSMAIGDSSTDFGTSASEFVTMAGTNGTLTINNTNSTFYVGLVTAGAGSEQATLDMSGLGAFNASVSSLAVGAVAATTFGNIGTAYLAETNNITAVGGVTNNESGQDEALSLMVGETGKNGSGTCYLYLGQQNAILANTIGVGLAKEAGQLLFNSTFVNPTATFYGPGGVGTPISVWSIGDGLAQSGGSTSPNGTVDFSGGTVNALVTTMYIARTPNASGGVAAHGTLTFGAGTIAAATVYDGYQAFNNTDWAIGNINVNGTGVLQVGTLNLSAATGGSGTNTTTGTLTISGGTVDAGTIVGSGLNQGSTVTLETSGTLVVSNAAGTPTAPLGALNLTGGSTATTVELPASATASAVVSNLTIDGLGTTTNVLNISSVSGTVTAGQELPVIKYTTFTDTGGTFNLGLGALPPNYGGYLTNDTTLSAIAVVFTSVPVSAPTTNATITQVSLSGTNLVVQGTNNNVPNTNFRYEILVSTNLALPLSSWTPVVTNPFTGNGTFDYTNPVVPGTPRQFIDVKVVQ